MVLIKVTLTVNTVTVMEQHLLYETKNGKIEINLFLDAYTTVHLWQTIQFQPREKNHLQNGRGKDRKVCHCGDNLFILQI